jgi:hypothetical protein
MKYCGYSKEIVQCEVVRVDLPKFLVSSRKQACRYETQDGKPLAPGYYLALWPAGAGRESYGDQLQYLGPFATADFARFLQASARRLGIIDITAERVRTTALPALLLPHQRHPAHAPTRAPSHNYRKSTSSMSAPLATPTRRALMPVLCGDGRDSSNKSGDDYGNYDGQN